MTGAVTRYACAAALARGADAGTAVGLVLLATATPGLDNPALVGALLVACLTGPHLLGPVLAGRLDRARDGRRLIAVACVLYGLAAGSAALLLGRAPVAVVAALAVLAGACGPLLTGGLSSMLGPMVAGDEAARRRAHGVDALTYGIAATAGPAAVAGLAGLAGAWTAMLAVAAASMLAATLVLTLPKRDAAVAPEDVPPLRHTLRLIVTLGPLRRVLYTTVAVNAPAGAMAVLAVALAPSLGVDPGRAGLLVAGFGLGYLAGSLAVTARPLLGDPDRLVTVTGLLVGGGYTLVALVPGYGLTMAAFALTGALQAPLFAATLTARARYSPPGARAQVFVSMAALKVAAASAATAAAGAAMALGPRALLLIGAALVLTSAALTIPDRRLDPGPA